MTVAVALRSAACVAVPELLSPRTRQPSGDAGSAGNAGPPPPTLTNWTVVVVGVPAGWYPLAFALVAVVNPEKTRSGASSAKAVALAVAPVAVGRTRDAP